MQCKAAAKHLVHHFTFRKASFCSRCLLIRGPKWSLSAELPSLSKLPHQSSSRRYSCSRLSSTLHTYRDTKSCLNGDPNCASVWRFEADLLRGLVERHRSIDQLQAVLHFQHQLLPVDSHLLSTVSNRLWIVVTCLKHHLRDEMRKGANSKRTDFSTFFSSTVCISAITNVSYSKMRWKQT